MWATSHSVGEYPLFCPRDMSSPPATACGQLFLVGEVFVQPEGGPLWEERTSACNSSSEPG